MKRKVILMTMALTSILALGNFSQEVRADINNEALDEIKSKVVEYLNDNSLSNENFNSVEFNLNDYINSQEQPIIENIPEINIPEINITEDNEGVAVDIEEEVNSDFSEASDNTDNILIKPLIIDNLLRIVKVGESYTINIVSSPSDVVFESSNPQIATVDENGKVVAIAEGKAFITVSTANGCSKRKAAVVVLKDGCTPGEDEPDNDKPDNDKPEESIPEVNHTDINVNININGNIPSVSWPSMDLPSTSLPSMSLPSTSWPSLGSTTGGTIGSLAGGYASKISSTPTTLSSAKSTSTSTLPNTGAIMNSELIGALSLLTGLGIYKKRK